MPTAALRSPLGAAARQHSGITSTMRFLRGINSASALGALFFVIAAAVFFGEVRSAPPMTVDDAFITFSFSRNVALGHGPVYGHGLVVEGYSNFLWMLIVAMGIFFRRDVNPVEIARVLTVPFVILMGVATYRLGRLKSLWLPSLAAVVVLALDSDVITAFHTGLETIPYTALLTLGFLVYCGSLARPALRPWVVPTFVAGALMRIDGVVPLAYILAFEAAREVLPSDRDRLGASLRAYARWALPAVALYAAWFAWRWHYYGLPLPSTYYAKALIPKLMPNRGWEYVRDEAMSSGLVWILPLAGVLLARGDARARAVVLFVLGHILYVVRVGGDWMPFGRFLLPILPLALVTAVWGGQALAAAVARFGTAAHRLALASPLAVLIWTALRTEAHLFPSALQQGKLHFAAEQIPHLEMLTEAARLLNHALWPGARLVTDYGGVFAYETDAEPIEMWGLCNATIATRGGTDGVQPIYGRTCPECYPELGPEFFHVMAPITRDLTAFKTHDEVIANVWQTDRIGRYLDFRRDFVTGRAMVPARNRAVYFLQRRSAGITFRPRAPAPDVVIDYPFEPGGRAPGL